MSAALAAWRSMSYGRRLTCIWALGLLIRVAYVVLVARHNALSGDGTSYHHGANLLADGQGFVEPFRYLFGNVETVTLGGEQVTITTPLGHTEPTAGHPPVWTVVLGVVSFLGFTSQFEHQLAGAILGSLTIFAIAAVARELRGDTAGLVGGAITAVYAFIWINDGLIMAETSAIPAAAVASLFGIRFLKNPTRGGAVAFGVVGAFAGLTRAELILFLPIVAALALLRAPLPWRERVVRYAIAGTVAVAVVAPWVVRNMVVFEEPVFLSNGAGTVLVQANCDDTYYGDNIGYWSLDCGGGQPYADDGSLLDESERDVVVREVALDYIEDNTGRLFSFVIPARIGRMWAVYDSVNQLRLDVQVEKRPFKISVLGLVQLAAMAPLAIVGSVSMWRRREPFVAVVLWAALATFTAAIAFGTTRYRTAAEVTVVVLATIAIAAIIERYSTATQAPSGSS